MDCYATGEEGILNTVYRGQRRVHGVCDTWGQPWTLNWVFDKHICEEGGETGKENLNKESVYILLVSGFFFFSSFFKLFS